MEVAPPSAANTIALVRLTEGEPAGGEATRCAFATEDIEADHADLRAEGVDADAEIAHTGKRRPGLVSTEVTIVDPVPRQFFFRDPDGNRFLIVQPD
jgi:catechol 2,3-dioxygenase-like lactoylglutathione lyase family enzyme